MVLHLADGASRSVSAMEAAARNRAYGATTTFSTFAVEALELFAAQRYAVAAIYLTASIGFGLGLAWLGMRWAARSKPAGACEEGRR